jgi:uncharacterized repeat protein (TIGR03803 family)
MRRTYAAATIVLVSVTPAAVHAGSTETVLYSFGGKPDGAVPASGLTADNSGSLYGTTTNGGVDGGGTVFRLAAPAWTETVVRSFKSGRGGFSPWAGLIEDGDGHLYGTTMLGGGGGAGGGGTAFKLVASGKAHWAETILHNFTMLRKGTASGTGLTADASGNLFGITRQGGAAGDGAVFELVPPVEGMTRWTEKVVHSFKGGTDGAYPPEPFATGGLMTDADGDLYGATYAGGINGVGILFKLAPPSGQRKFWSEAVLYTFAGGTDGANPQATLIADASGNLYGTTATGGGAGNAGTVFKLAPPTQGQTVWTEAVIHSFTGGAGGKDGANPSAGVIADSRGNLYGTTDNGWRQPKLFVRGLRHRF